MLNLITLFNPLSIKSLSHNKFRDIVIFASCYSVCNSDGSFKYMSTRSVRIGKSRETFLSPPILTGLGNESTSTLNYFDFCSLYVRLGPIAISLSLQIGPSNNDFMFSSGDYYLLLG